MTIDDMHLAIDMDLQKVNTFVNKNLLPQEKDFFINGEVLKFIKNRVSPISDNKKLGIDSTTKRYEDLDDIINEETIDVELDSENSGVCILPSDYHFYISSKSNVYQTCENESINTQSNIIYKCVFPFEFEEGVVITDYIIELNTPTIKPKLFDFSDLPSGYIESVDINKQKFILLKAIKIKMNEVIKNLNNTYGEGTHSIYWQRYGNEFHNNHFILVSKYLNLGVDVKVNEVSNATLSQAMEYNTYNLTTNLWAKNRLPEKQYRYSTEQSYLSNNIPESPVIDLSKNIIKIDFPNGGIIQKIKLTYISTPLLVDLLLKQNLNLSNTICREIISNTVRFIKGVFKGDYETYFKENIMIE